VKAALLLPALLLWPVAAAAEPAFELESSLALVSDYRWRGVSLSDGQAGVQAEASVSHASGAWLWAGANSVSADYGGSETGIGAGYSLGLAGLEWSAGATRYFYSGEDGLDYTELAFSADAPLGAATFSAGVEYAPEQQNYEADDTYLWLGASIEAPRGLRMHGHVGRDDGIMAAREEPTTDFSLGLALGLQGFEVDLAYVEAEGVDQALVLSLARFR